MLFCNWTAAKLQVLYLAHVISLTACAAGITSSNISGVSSSIQTPHSPPPSLPPQFFCAFRESGFPFLLCGPSAFRLVASASPSDSVASQKTPHEESSVSHLIVRRVVLDLRRFSS